MVKYPSPALFHLQLIDLGLCVEIDDASNQPSTRGNHIGTRGYRSPSLIKTGRCEYHDDMWVAAVIVVEMALGVRLYDTAAAQHQEMQARHKKSRAKSRDEARCRALEENIRNVTGVVLSGQYFPWRVLAGLYSPELVDFLQRVTRDKAPYFNSVADVLLFIKDRQNIPIFKRHRLRS